MTVIEIYDNSPIKNITGVLSLKPERVVYLGSIKAEKFEASDKPRYEKFLKSKGIETEIIYRQVRKDDTGDICEKIQAILEEDDDCRFDIVGGDESTLVTLGMMFAEGYNIKLFRVNINSGMSYTWEYGDTEPVRERVDDLCNSIEDNMLLHGAAVVYEEQKPGKTRIWDMDDEFLDDIDLMWDICCNGISIKGINESGKANTRVWNSVTSTFGNILSLSKDTGDENSVFIDTEAAKRSVQSKGGFCLPKHYLKRFADLGLITFDEKAYEDKIVVTFKNDNIRHCLTKAGTLLELKTYLACLDILDSNDAFNDCMTGVSIDWDGEIHSELSPKEYARASAFEKEQNIEDTENEIDVILMKGLVPVFISCKNGSIEMEELYKLQSVSERFGSKFAKKFIVATDPSANEYKFNYFEQRAEDMGIGIIEGVHKMSEIEFRKALNVMLHN